MKVSSIFLISFIAFGAMLSCSKKNESDLTVELRGSDKAFLIDSSSQSCYNQVQRYLAPETDLALDVPSKYFSIPAITLSWKNSEATAFISYIKIELKGGAIAGTCTFSEGNLQAIFHDYTAGSPTAGLWSNSLPPQTGLTPSTRASSCPIKCGGVVVANPGRAAFASGTLTVVGFQRKDNGEERPFRVTENIGVSYE